MPHKFWGQVVEDEIGFSGDVVFAQPFFSSAVPVMLGDDYTEEATGHYPPPSAAELAEFADTYRAFLASIDEHLAALQNHAYAYYRRVYANYYEDSRQSGEPPLGIDTVEKHNHYITNLLRVHVTAGHTLHLSINYKLDAEHGLEVKFVNGAVERVGGIADT